MSRIITTDIFIQMAHGVHGQRYDYSKVFYVKSHDKIEIICPDHGLFSQTPNGHLNGAGCLKCAIEKIHARQRLTSEEFINRAKTIHKDKYVYDKTVYRGYENKVVIGCPKHGVFEQRVGDHLRGEGCPKCAVLLTGEIGRMSLSDFVAHSKEIHGNKYDYGRVVYKNNRTKVALVCSVHGEFFVSPDNHFKGYGCKKCNRDARCVRHQADFIERAKKVHPDYDYSESVFVEGHKKEIKIICPKHGSFYQDPYRHLKGSGCPSCILKEETKLGEILKGFFVGWKIERHKKIFSKEHGRQRCFDFFITNGSIDLVVEYDGLQHFKPIRFNYKMSQKDAEKKFEAQKKTDALDIVFCERKRIRLYRVSCKDSMIKAVDKIYADVGAFLRYQ